jgi:hypothetical protein
LAATTEESRTTWLLLALIALAGRLAAEDPEGLAAHFPDARFRPRLAIARLYPEFALRGFPAEMAFSSEADEWRHPLSEETETRRCRCDVEDRDLFASAEPPIREACLEGTPQFPERIVSVQSPDRAQQGAGMQSGALVLGVLVILALGVSMGSRSAHRKV